MKIRKDAKFSERKQYNREQEAQKLKRRSELFMEVLSEEYGDPAIKLDARYTKIINPLGSSTEMNSPLTVEQLAFTLALSSHSTVEQLLAHIESRKINSDNFVPNRLKEDRVLQGIKILDLGCGEEPAFSRCAREFGAEVFTVDVIASSDFEIYQPTQQDIDSSSQWNPSAPDALRQLRNDYELIREIENKQHIQIDLREPDAVRKILEITGGNFDLVTTAHIDSGSVHQGQKVMPPTNLDRLIQPLLKTGGTYFDPLNNRNKCSIKS